MQQLERKFKIGALILNDPNPSLTIDQVREIHAKQYPLVRSVKLWESDGNIEMFDGYNVLMYTYSMPPTSVNG